MGVWRTHYRGCGHTTAQPVERGPDGYVDVDGRCPACAAELVPLPGSGRGPRSAQPVKQNRPTALVCPEDGGQLLVMTRKRDGHPFLACRNFYDPARRCRYTRDDVPPELLP